MKKVDYRSIAPIYADVMVSPWNLLVGGLLITYLPATSALFSILIGYAILGAIFYFYGGLGFRDRKQSADIINSIFGSKITRYIVPSILAIGQIGWASINIELGGKSLAYIFSSPMFIGIAFYALFLVLMGILDLYKMGIVKLLITISSVGLLAYVFISKLGAVPFTDFLAYKPVEPRTLLWGMSIVVASLISFSTVTPDFFQSIRSKKDILLSILLGLYVPGTITAFLGSFLFYDRGNFDLIALISALTFPIFPHVLNASTNTDGSIAIYTPGLKLKNMFGINLRSGILIAGTISFGLALFQVSQYLEIWLKTLSLLFPSLIGIVLAKELIHDAKENTLFDRSSLYLYGFSTLVGFGIANFFPPVLIMLVLPFLIFKGYNYIKKGI